VAVFLGKRPKATVLFSGDGLNDFGLSLEVVESKSKKWILDGISLDLMGGKKNVALGVSKDLYKNSFIEIDAGLFISRPIANLLDGKTELNIGISGRF